MELDQQAVVTYVPMRGRGGVQGMEISLLYWHAIHQRHLNGPRRDNKCVRNSSILNPLSAVANTESRWMVADRIKRRERKTHFLRW